MLPPPTLPRPSPPQPSTGTTGYSMCLFCMPLMDCAHGRYRNSWRPRRADTRPTSPTLPPAWRQQGEEGAAGHRPAACRPQQGRICFVRAQGITIMQSLHLSDARRSVLCVARYVFSQRRCAWAAGRGPAGSVQRPCPGGARERRTTARARATVGGEPRLAETTHGRVTYRQIVRSQHTNLLSRTFALCLRRASGESSRCATGRKGRSREAEPDAVSTGL